MHDKENGVYQKLWGEFKTVFRGQFISVIIYIIKQERLKANDLRIHLKNLKINSELSPKKAEGRK